MSDQDSIEARCYGWMTSSGAPKVTLIDGRKLSILLGQGGIHLFISVDDWDTLADKVNDVLYPMVTRRIRFDDVAATATVVPE